jgi:exopolysaccharide production protein ExoQ
MLIGSSRPVGMWLYPESSTTEATVLSGSLPDQIVLGVLILLSIFVLARRRIAWQDLMKENRWALVLIIYMGMSILWSGYAVVSLKRWVKVAGLVLAAMVIMTESDPLGAVETVLRRTGYVLIPVSIVLIKYFPEFGIDYGRWGGGRMARGVCMQKNGLGLLCAVVGLFIIWDLARKLRLRELRSEKATVFADICVLLATIYLLKGADTSAYSATAIGALLIGLLAMFAMWRLRGHPEEVYPLSVTVAVLAGAILLSSSLVLGSTPMKWWAQLLGRDETMTGRTDIWASIFEIAPEWSMLGTGFGGFWGLPYTFIPIGQMTGHSGYVDAYVELGAVGILVLAVFLLNSWRRLGTLVRRHFDWGVLGFCLLLISVVYNYSESDFLSSSSPLWTALLFTTFAMGRAGSGIAELHVKTAVAHADFRKERDLLGTQL